MNGLTNNETKEEIKRYLETNEKEKHSNEKEKSLKIYGTQQKQF